MLSYLERVKIVFFFIEDLRCYEQAVEEFCFEIKIRKLEIWYCMSFIFV